MCIRRMAQASGRAAGGCGWRGALWGQPAAQRARARHGGAAAGPAAGAGYPVGRVDGALGSSRPVRERSRNVRCNHSWNHACSEASDPRRGGHSADAAN
jgi:hypothetical protein